MECVCLPLPSLLHLGQNPSEVPPVLSDSKNYLVSVKHDQLYFIAVCLAEGECYNSAWLQISCGIALP